MGKPEFNQSGRRRQPHRRRRRRRQNAAMKDEEGLEDSKHRARTGRGEKSSERHGSSHPQSSRDSDSRARHHSPRIEPSSEQRRHRSRERHSDHRHRSPGSPTRQREDKEDLIPRYREKRQKERAGGDDSRTGRRSRSVSQGREGDLHQERRTVSSTKRRHRSRSRSPHEPHRKRSRRDHHSLTRQDSRERSPDRRSRRRRHSSHDRRKPSSRHSRSNRSLDRQEKHRPPRSTKRSRSRSPHKENASTRRSRPEHRDTRRQERSSYPSRSRSPRSSRPQTRSPRGDRSEPGLSSSRRADIDRYVSGPREPSSDTSHRDRRFREDETDSYHPPRTDLEDDMDARGGYRGGYHPSHSQTMRGGDPRAYSQSPQHQASYHASRDPSPYGAGRGAWGGPQYSPSPQYPPQYHSGPGGYGPPPGHSPHYHHPSHSPPYATPSGPVAYQQTSYRGAPRGGGFRGAAFGGRVGNRGSNFKPGAFNQSQGGHDLEMEEGRHHSSSNSQNGEEYGTNAQEFDDDTPKGPRADMGPPPQAPSGPAARSGGSKFSFAFKASSKPNVTAPKPEISQKFNIAPRKAGTADTSDPLLKAAPTGPASARNADDAKGPPTGPRIAPRMRKVKKMMKRPKPKPQLAVELAESDSVYYRKPGNESVIGSGTYGKVFKGLNVYTKGLVALKRIRMEGERDGFPVTAVREIKLLQSLRHVNIVNLQEVMVEKNDCFMVFEYLSHDLTGLLNHPSFKLEPAQKKHMAQQLFQGLDYLHTRGVLHRDIKAANILVSNEGILKLADFGLARFYAKRHQLDYTNRVITIWYRSPELLLGETQYTAAVDVWSAACVMVEIFCKYPVFAGDGTELNQLDKIYNILGTPNRQDWPGLVDMAWFELLRPTARRKSSFADKYQDKLTPAAFELLSDMFCYDPTKRPTAEQVLHHRYFLEEEPSPRQAKELSDIDGDWHEHESKALRKERERQEKEARRAKEGTEKGSFKDRSTTDKKRPMDATSGEGQRETKRVALEPEASGTKEGGSASKGHITVKD